jgi:hypothetical protein
MDVTDGRQSEQFTGRTEILRSVWIEDGLGPDKSRDLTVPAGDVESVMKPARTRICYLAADLSERSGDLACFARRIVRPSRRLKIAKLIRGDTSFFDLISRRLSADLSAGQGAYRTIVTVGNEDEARPVDRDPGRTVETGLRRSSVRITAPATG